VGWPEVAAMTRIRRADRVVTTGNAQTVEAASESAWDDQPEAMGPSMA
jgi:hypothetical protein